MDFKDRLRSVIAESSIEEFARLVDESPQRIKDVLREKQKPPSDLLIKLHNKLGVDITWLLTGGGATPPEDALSAREAALLKNYRQAAEDGRRAIEATSAAVGKVGERMDRGMSLEKVQGKVRRKAA